MYKIEDEKMENDQRSNCGQNAMVVHDGCSTADDSDLTALPPIRTPKEPGKWRGYDSRRVFKKEWLKEYEWLASDPTDPTHAMCKTCGKKIRAHKGDIEKHQKTKRHSKKHTNTTDILADLIPISCGDGLNNGDDYSRHENIECANNSEMDQSGARIVTHPGGADGDGQQIIYYTESAVDASHQNTNTVIDKLVEKYHQKRIENLKVEHESTLNLNKEQLGILKQQLEGEGTLHDNKNTLFAEEHDIRLKFMQREHEARLKAIEDERGARLQVIEQELMFTRQEYEKKMRLLDVQLSSMKEPTMTRAEIPRMNGHFSANSNRNDMATGPNYMDAQSGPKPGENQLHIMNLHSTRNDIPPGSNQCLY